MGRLGLVGAEMGWVDVVEIVDVVFAGIGFGFDFGAGYELGWRCCRWGVACSAPIDAPEFWSIVCVTLTGSVSPKPVPEII
ncbi:hypothetical protein [Nocardia sp. CA-120079]|uniref:hypothetical protein n=1 Tax=Nocardia sp. CA-120079 TaxID=3239974 RepID=UPI003D9574A1